LTEPTLERANPYIFKYSNDKGNMKRNKLIREYNKAIGQCKGFLYKTSHYKNGDTANLRGIETTMYLTSIELMVNRGDKSSNNLLEDIGFNNIQDAKKKCLEAITYYDSKQPLGNKAGMIALLNLKLQK